ncbi:MAG: FKBP-type peptidyl-prolyl cis-trans isomerase [Chitinophagaceae bacterium]|nr:FKBP-type peptidyl-prolyl cis-trans isomerase [Chitinophagaceae bacterium]
MFKKNASLLLACFIFILAKAQITKPVAAPGAKRVYNFTTINPKLQYVFIENKNTSQRPQEGDDVMMHMIAICNNRFMYNSSQLNKGKPAAFSLSKPAFKGDIMEALVLMTPGDSIICMVDAKSMFDYTKKEMPDFIKPGDKIQYNIRLVSIIPKEQLQKEREAAMMKALQEPQPVQNPDDDALKAYFNSNQLNPIKTSSGLYYSIQQEGSGPLAKTGDMVTMNYRGTLLDGTVFDSNLDSAFKHVQPLTFVLGTGRVIKGWDEGIGYLKPGSKATFYIPSSLAYGAQSRPGNAANPKGIPANSVLIFDVELVAAKPPSSN